MRKSSKTVSRFDSVDDSENITASESLISTVKETESNPTKMESPSNSNDNMNYVTNRHGYIRFDDRSNRCSSIKGLQYPKGIDPYKIWREIIFLILICISIIGLFGISFINILFCKNLDLCKPSYKEMLIEESMMCGLVLLSGCLLTLYGFRSQSWIQSILNRGFYTFSDMLQRKRIIIIFIWFASVFVFSPVLIALRAVCDKSTNTTQTSDIICCIHGFCSFTKYNWLQFFLGVKAIVVLVGLVYYLIIVCKFKISRQWPDVWHENLLEESPMIENCPLIKRCELRIDNSSAACESTISISTGTAVPDDRDIMRLQAYMIKYLRHLNSEMARKIFRLHASIPSDQSTSGESLDGSESRECHFESTVVPSVVVPTNARRC